MICLTECGARSEGRIVRSEGRATWGSYQGKGRAAAEASPLTTSINNRDIDGIRKLNKAIIEERLRNGGIMEMTKRKLHNGTHKFSLKFT